MSVGKLHNEEEENENTIKVREIIHNPQILLYNVCP